MSKYKLHKTHQGYTLHLTRFHPLCTGPPGPPQNVEVVACIGRSAQLRWEKGKENGAEISRYIVQFNTSDTPDRWHDYFEQFPTGARQATIELSPWGTYAFRVKAMTELGVSKPSAVTAGTCTTPPERPDTNPKNVRTRTDIKNMLVVEWNVSWGCFLSVCLPVCVCACLCVCVDGCVCECARS